MLGIDPGSRITGYGVVERKGGRLYHIVHGELKPGAGVVLSTCLEGIWQGIQEVIRETRPQAMVIEDIFYGKNVKSLIKQGHVRGVAILAGKSMGLPIYEYSPLEIKKAVVGYGRAEKEQVQQMTKAILKLTELPTPDAADALAAAICHVNFLKTESI